MHVRTKLLLWLLPPLLLLISTLLFYIFSPQIAQYALRNWLQQQNFSHVELDMQPPGWNSWHIKQLTLSKQEDERELLTTSRNILIRFNPVTLFLNETIDEIRIDQSQLTITYHSLPEAEPSPTAVDLSRVLPSQWFSELPVDLLRIGQLKVKLDYPESTSDWLFTSALDFNRHTLTSRVHMQRDQQDLGWSDLTASDNDHFTLRMLIEEQPFVQVEGRLFYEDALKLESAQTIALKHFLDWQSKMLAVEITHPEVSGTLSTQGITAFPLKTRFTPDDLLLSVVTEQNFEASLSVDKPAPEIASINANLQGKLGFSRNHLELSLADKTQLHIQGISHSSLKSPIKQLQLLLPQGLNIRTDLAKTMKTGVMTPKIKPLDVQLILPDIYLNQGTLKATTMKTMLKQLDLEKQLVSGEIKNLGLKFEQPEQSIPEAKLDLDFTFNAGTFDSRFSLITEPLPLQLTGNIQSHFDTLKSEIKWEIKPIDLNKIDRSLEPYLNIPAELSISNGTLFHNGSAKISAGKLTATAYNSIRSAGASWEDYRFENLDWDSRTQLYASGKIRDKGSVKLQRATTGVDVTEITTHYQFEQTDKSQQLTLEELNANLLEGSIRMAPVSFDPTNPEFATSVQVEQIDLGEVLSLEQQEGLSGEGKLSGEFPLQYKNSELTIEDGGLFSLKPGGKIMFAANPTVMAYAATNVGLKMALEALENFHFDTLDIKLNYAKDGTAHLNTRLKGNNPDWNNGHPVDFTINIEENIPKLLQTLQFTEKLTKSIEKRYR